jgi:hypothetical protein
MSEIATRTKATLENLATEINAEHRAFIGSLKKTAEHAVRCGELLTEAKSRCRHGEWLPWLEANFEGSPRTAQTYMQLYDKRDELRAKTQNSAHLSISGALKEISAPQEESEKEPEEATFEDVVELTRSFREIRDRELFRGKGYETFEAYMRGEWPERAEEMLEGIPGWELVIDNPPPELRGAKQEKALELLDRLKKLMVPPEAPGLLVAAGRQLQEIEDRELYKLIGFSSYSEFCRKQLRLSPKYRSVFALAVEMADIHPMFDLDVYDFTKPLPHEPELSKEDWERGMELMREFVELTGE